VNYTGCLLVTTLPTNCVWLAGKHFALPNLPNYLTKKLLLKIIRTHRQTEWHTAGFRDTQRNMEAAAKRSHGNYWQQSTIQLFTASSYVCQRCHVTATICLLVCLSYTVKTFSHLGTNTLSYCVRSTQWPIKRANIAFVCNFVNNQRILMQFSLLDFKMNDTCEGMHFTHLT